MITQQVSIITEDIIEKYEKKLLDKIINTHYFYFLNYEKVKIINKALERLKNNEDEAANLRSDIIREKLEEYFVNNKISINSDNVLEGFVRFRLREYYSVLETIVDDAAQEYLIEREYEEFIGLLKYFVEISECKMSVLYVVTTDYGYKFFDNNKKDITNECLSDFLTPIEEIGLSGFNSVPIIIAEESINYDDMLISTLIMLSPAKILWSGINPNLEIVQTVKKIFGSNVEIFDLVNNTNH